MQYGLCGVVRHTRFQPKIPELITKPQDRSNCDRERTSAAVTDQSRGGISCPDEPTAGLDGVTPPTFWKI